MTTIWLKNKIQYKDESVHSDTTKKIKAVQQKPTKNCNSQCSGRVSRSYSNYIYFIVLERVAKGKNKIDPYVYIDIRRWVKSAKWDNSASKSQFVKVTHYRSKSSTWSLDSHQTASYKNVKTNVKSIQKTKTFMNHINNNHWTSGDDFTKKLTTKIDRKYSVLFMTKDKS